MIIKINVANKIPTVDGEPIIICSNNDYVIQFAFDQEWDPEAVKTARFLWRRAGKLTYKDVPFTGDMVEVPILSGIHDIWVGVYTNDLRTTTPARIACEYSVLCKSHNAAPAAAPEGDPDAAVRYTAQHLTEAEQAQARANIGVDLSNYYTKEIFDEVYKELVEALQELVDLPHLSEDQVQTMIDASIAQIAVYNGEAEEVDIIDFTIEDSAFQAEAGMTWFEWVNSEYNPGYITCDSETSPILFRPPSGMVYEIIPKDASPAGFYGDLIGSTPIWSDFAYSYISDNPSFDFD